MIVTTFSPDGYIQYGKKFIETYKKYCKYPLIVYVEDDLKIEGVEVRQLYDVPGCREFLSRISNYKPDHYRRDVNKFSRKVFAICDAMKRYNGSMAFVGADTVFQKDIPDSFLDDMLEDVYLAYLGRSNYHSETDFIAFDTTHQVNHLFRELFLSIYTTGSFQHLKYYCDSDVFDFVRTTLNIPENNLNIIDDKNHPFVNSILGEYMDHLKGPERKTLGRSLKEDYVNQ